MNNYKKRFIYWAKCDRIVPKYAARLVKAHKKNVFAGLAAHTLYVRSCNKK